MKRGIGLSSVFLNSMVRPYETWAYTFVVSSCASAFSSQWPQEVGPPSVITIPILVTNNKRGIGLSSAYFSIRWSDPTKLGRLYFRRVQLCVSLFLTMASGGRTTFCDHHPHLGNK